MKRFLIVLLVLLSYTSLAQDNFTDSLKQILSTEIADTTRVLLLRDLAFSYSYSWPDSALFHAQQGTALARQF